MSDLPRWSRSTKQLVSATILIVMALLLYSFRTILLPIILVLLFSYIAAPAVGWLSKRLHIGRAWSVLIVYLVCLGVVATLPAVTIPVIVDEVENLVRNLDAIANRAVTWLEQLDQYRFEVLGYVIALPKFESPTLSFEFDRIMELINSAISPLAGGAFSVVRTVASGVGWLIFMSVMGFYLLRDADRLIPTLLSIIPAPYRSEAAKLVGQINATWNAFLRGQIVLCLVIGVLTTVAMSAVGIRFAVALGIIAGILEIVPNLGPTLASVPAILLALFQGSSYIPMSKLGVAILVAGIYWMIQNVENTVLVPRIIGSSLNLHPLMVIVGVLAGATLGGTLGPLGTIVGALLAAPVLATLRHVFRYVYCKLADLDPFPTPPSFAAIARERGVRAILFDLDGTLIDSDNTLVERWAAALARVPLLTRLCDAHKLARRLLMLTSRPANAVLTVVDWLGLDAKLFALSEWVRLARGEPQLEEMLAIDGSIEFVRELCQHYDLAITTTRNRATAQAFVEQFGLQACFKAVVTRQDVKRLKPHPEPIRHAAGALGYDPEECIVVGDMGVDVQAGKRAGALTVGVLSGFGEAQRLSQLEPDLVLETASQLRQHLPRRESVLVSELVRPFRDDDSTR
ncbi:MAG: AI-2E family transporter [Anaerolineae bacterium]|nr:AI-2E family transporter [Anaerolineae bacterium]